MDTNPNQPGRRDKRETLDPRIAPPPTGGRFTSMAEDAAAVEAAREAARAAAQPHSFSDAMAQAGKHLKELQAYVGYYIAAKTDGIKLTLKNVVVYAGLGIVGLVAAAGFLVVAVVQLCYGIAGALGALFGGRLWLGELITGFLLLAGIGIGAYVALNSLTSKSRKATVEKYEARQRQQRQDHGHDVNERAREQRLQQA